MVWKDPINGFLYGFIDKLDSAMDSNSLEPRLVREAWAGALPLGSLIVGLLGEIFGVRPESCCCPGLTCSWAVCGFCFRRYVLYTVSPRERTVMARLWAIRD